jgi:hypothetical protein
MAHYEDRKELRGAVERKRGAAIPNETWEMVEPNWSGPYGDADLAEVLDSLAYEGSDLVPVKLKDRRKQAKEPRATLRKAYEHARSECDRRTVAEAHYVARVRQQLFQTGSPPFRDMEQAREWINRQREDEVKETVHVEGEAVLPDGSLAPKRSRVESLDWPGASDWVEGCPVVEGKELDILRVASETLASRLDCQPAQATAHILTGVIPFVAPVKHTVHNHVVKTNKGWETRPRISLEINYDWVPVSVVAQVYSHVLRQSTEQSFWGRRRKSRRSQPSPIAAEVEAFLAEHEDKKGWDLLRLWNESHPEHKSAHWRYLLRRRY